MRFNEEEQYFEIDPVEQEPKDFVEDKMKGLFNMLEDMKLELRGYTLAELDEVKEHARPFMAVSNRTMIMFASYIVDQCNYQKTIMRAAAASKQKAGAGKEATDD